MDIGEGSPWGLNLGAIALSRFTSIISELLFYHPTGYQLDARWIETCCSTALEISQLEIPRFLHVEMVD